MPVSGAVSSVTEAATRPGSSASASSQEPHSATQMSTCSWSTSADPSGSAPSTTVKSFVDGTSISANGRP